MAYILSVSLYLYKLIQKIHECAKVMFLLLIVHVEKTTCQKMLKTYWIFHNKLIIKRSKLLELRMNYTLILNIVIFIALIILLMQTRKTDWSLAKKVFAGLCLGVVF